MKIYHFEQHSDDWYDIRKGKFTASQAKTIATAGVGLETLCFDLATEILTNKTKPVVSTTAMQQGNDLENNARTLFELETGYTVDQVGFVELDEMTGCSPDGLILDRTAGIEIKCPQDNTYTRYLFNGEIKPEHYAQIQMNLLITNCAKWYYVVFNNNFKEQIVIKEILPDLAYQDKIKHGLEKGKTFLTNILKTINERS